MCVEVMSNERILLLCLTVQSTMDTTDTTLCIVNNSVLYSHSVMYVSYHSKSTLLMLLLSVYGTHKARFIIESSCVYCEVQNKLLNICCRIFVIQWIN
jgi:hypothetical protein